MLVTRFLLGFLIFPFLIISINGDFDYDYEEYKDYIDYLEQADKNEVEYTLQSISVGKRTSHSDQSCPECKCGKPNRWNRIVGGGMTEVHEYPWVAALSYKGRFFCGGSLITDQHVLTAGHCVVKSTTDKDTNWVKSSVMVVLAEHNTAVMEETMTVSSKVSEVIVHPEFVRATFNHDLALLRLEKKVQFGDDLRTVCLPPPGGDYAGSWGTITGWGLTSEGGSASAYLREASVPVLSLNQCRNRGYNASKITDYMICAGDYRKVDSCQGDSGGALLVTNDFQQMMTVGIVSWGEGCARPNKPGVYSRVDQHVNWILKSTENACYCF